MKALTERQPYASMIAAGVKTIVTRPRPVGYRGRVAIHAAKRPLTESEAPITRAEKHVAEDYPEIADALGAVVASAVITDCVPIETPDSENARGPLMLWTSGAGDLKFARHVERGPLDADEHPWVTEADLDDQLPFGDFSPGRWALLLDDIAPTTDRCPACWGQDFPECSNGCGCRTFEDADLRDCGCDGPCTGATEELDAVWQIRWCPACEGVSACDPVPARGRSGLWEWTP